jgi:hypothetical protein
MPSHSHSQKKNTDPAFVPQIQSQLQSSSWVQSAETMNPGLDAPEVQMEPEPREGFGQGFGHSLGNVSISSPATPPESPGLSPIQMKGLTIGKPGDKYEQEADTVARKVVTEIHQAPVTQRKSEDISQPQIAPAFLRLKSNLPQPENIGGGEASTKLTGAINSAKGGGQALHEPLRMKVEQAMGSDFSGVKVHHDTNADTLNRSLSARAFTTGEHIFFKRGEYQPESRGGQELIAHELTHVVQQGAGTIPSVQMEGDKSKSLTEEQQTASQAAYDVYTKAVEAVKQSNLLSEEQRKLANEFFQKIAEYGSLNINQTGDLNKRNDLKKDINLIRDGGNLAAIEVFAFKQLLTQYVSLTNEGRLNHFKPPESVKIEPVQPEKPEAPTAPKQPKLDSSLEKPTSGKLPVTLSRQSYKQAPGVPIPSEAKNPPIKPKQKQGDKLPELEKKPTRKKIDIPEFNKTKPQQPKLEIPQDIPPQPPKVKIPFKWGQGSYEQVPQQIANPGKEATGIHAKYDNARMVVLGQIEPLYKEVSEWAGKSGNIDIIKGIPNGILEWASHSLKSIQKLQKHLDSIKKYSEYCQEYGDPKVAQKDWEKNKAAIEKINSVIQKKNATLEEEYRAALAEYEAAYASWTEQKAAAEQSNQNEQEEYERKLNEWTKKDEFLKQEIAKINKKNQQLEKEYQEAIKKYGKDLTEWQTEEQKRLKNDALNQTNYERQKQEVASANERIKKGNTQSWKQAIGATFLNLGLDAKYKEDSKNYEAKQAENAQKETEYKQIYAEYTKLDQKYKTLSKQSDVKKPASNYTKELEGYKAVYEPYENKVKEYNNKV